MDYPTEGSPQSSEKRSEAFANPSPALWPELLGFLGSSSSLAFVGCSVMSNFYLFAGVVLGVAASEAVPEDGQDIPASLAVYFTISPAFEALIFTEP